MCVGVSIRNAFFIHYSYRYGLRRRPARNKKNSQIIPRLLNKLRTSKLQTIVENSCNYHSRIHEIPTLVNPIPCSSSGQLLFFISQTIEISFTFVFQVNPMYLNIFCRAKNQIQVHR